MLWEVLLLLILTTEGSDEVKVTVPRGAFDGTGSTRRKKYHESPASISMLDLLMEREVTFGPTFTLKL